MWSAANCTSSGASSATGRRVGKTMAAPWNTTLGKINEGFEVTLVRETERMKKPQINVFRGVF